MHIKKIILALFAVYLHVHLINAQEKSIFPRILWVYWNSGYENASLWTKLCLNNMKNYAKLSNWEFRFLSDQTFNNYLSQKSQQIIKCSLNNKNWDLGLPQKADLIRLHLLYENGGVWIDTNSVWLNDFSWIDNLDQQVGINITNKIGNYPEYLAFTYDIYIQNKTKVFDKKYQIQVELFPGVEIWFILAKKQSLFLKDVLDNIQYTLGKSRSELQNQYKIKGILYSGRINQYMILSNVQFQTLLQIKQKEIDANPQKFSVSYAVEYYKLWTIRSQNSALLIDILAKDGYRMYTMMQQSLQNIIKEYQLVPIFIKFPAYYYQKINLKVEQLAKIKCKQRGGKDLVKNQSLLYQYIYKYSLNIQKVKRITECKIKDPKCQLKKTVKNIFFYIFLLKYIGLFVAIILFIQISQAITPQNEFMYQKIDSQ